MTRWLSTKGLQGLVLSCALGMVAACSSTPPAQEPEAPPPLDDAPASSSASAPASNAQVQQGIDAIQAGDYRNAKVILQQAHRDHPNDPQAAFYLGVALEGSDDKPGAIAAYQKALALDSKLLEARVNLSALQLEGGDTQAALQTIEEGLKAAPKHPELLTNRALALESAGSSEEALQAYAAAVAAKADDPALRYAYAELLAKAGKKDQAVVELRQLGAGADQQVLAAAANLFGKLSAYADCVALLDKAMKAGATPEVHVRRGVCRHGMKDESGAKQDYEAALALDANFAPAHFYLGQHYKTTDKKKACASLAKAVELGGSVGVGQAAKKEHDELKCK